MTLTVRGLGPWLQVGSRIELDRKHEGKIIAELITLRLDSADAMALGSTEGIAIGTSCRLAPPLALPVSDAWIGRVIDPLGRPIDGAGPLAPGAELRPLRAEAPPAGGRASLGPRVDLGVRALDVFITCRRGQRLGLFAGSGVGKSSLLGMIGRGAASDVTVVALVGERGRELLEFIADDLGTEGLKRSVVVCATSDAPAPLRRDAALCAVAIAEHFADSGRHVMLLMDSVTRFAQALREIGLASGELPVARGYTPSVFAELPRLLERAGPRNQGCRGTITGIFTVLVEGDDNNEPISDAVRGTLDGHVLLDRRIAERGRYPAIDVLRSLSRCAATCISNQEMALIQEARSILLAANEENELLQYGMAWRVDSSKAETTLSLALKIESVFKQPKYERSTILDAFSRLALAIGGDVENED